MCNCPIEGIPKVTSGVMYDPQADAFSGLCHRLAEEDYSGGEREDRKGMEQRRKEKDGRNSGREENAPEINLWLRHRYRAGLRYFGAYARYHYWALPSPSFLSFPSPTRGPEISPGEKSGLLD